MLRLLGLLPWYLGFLQLPSLRFQFSLLFESKPALSGRPEVVPLEDDQALDDFEADHHVWNDLLQLLVHHAIAPFWVPALMIPLSALWP